MKDLGVIVAGLIMVSFAFYRLVTRDPKWWEIVIYGLLLDVGLITTDMGLILNPWLNGLMLNILR